MNISQIRLGLGRVKSSCARRDLERALDLAIAALDALGGQTPPTDLRGDIRNAVASLAADPDIRAHAPAPLAYQPGMEQDLARSLRQVRDGLKTPRNRKIMRQPCSASNSWTAGSRTARPFWPKASPQRPTPVLPKPCAITGMKRPCSA